MLKRDARLFYGTDKVREFLAQNPKISDEIEEKIREALKEKPMEVLDGESEDENGIVITEEFGE